MLVFLDTETTGLPKKRHASTFRTSNWPRIVEIAWIECNEEGTVRAEYTNIIRPESFEIPADAAAIHGITTSRALKRGVPINPVLREFHNSLLRSSYLIGHNLDFDTKVVLAEYIRAGLFWPYFQFLWKKQICTMTSSKNFCRIRTGKGYYKYPKLSELHFKLFGRAPDEKHQALEDARTCMKCYFELKKRKIIKI
jgi:DNA polymerase III, epsilon subunit and related 3''-5'' exonucleases